MRWGWLAWAVVAAGCSLDAAGQGQLTGDEAGVVDAASDASPDADVVTDSPAVDASGDASADSGVVDAPLEATVDAGPPITITGGSYDLLGQDAGTCTANSGASVTFKLNNKHATSVDLLWVNSSCAEVKYATVASNGSHSQQTYINHVWRVRNTANTDLLGEFRLTGTGAFTVTVH